MVFLPRGLLKERMALKQIRATVDAKHARSIYFRSQAAVEEGTGAPCWAERGYVWLLCMAVVLLLFASLYYAFVRDSWVGVVVIVMATLGAVRLEALALKHLTPLLFVLLFGDLVVVVALDIAWLKFLI